MRYAYFPGCKIAHHLPQYGTAVEAVCDALDIGLEKVEFNCCGWPVRHENELASIFSAIRNFALAEAAGLPIMSPCKCCFGNLKYAVSRVQEDKELAGRVEELLVDDGLSMPTRMEALHFLTVLDEKVGADLLAQRTATPLAGVKVACHYGCHALRPGNVTEFDDPLAPTVFERLMRAIGAEPVEWDLRLECCGHPLRGRDNVISDALMRKKLENAQGAGADVVATGCTYCQLQFDVERDAKSLDSSMRKAPPAVLAAQLIGVALGLKADAVGLAENRIPWQSTVL